MVGTDGLPKIALLAGLLLALLPQCFGYMSQGYLAVSIWTFGWEGLVGIALAITALFLALGYIFASFTGDDRLRSWVRHETLQLAFSLLIVICALAIVESSDAWMRILSLSGSDAWQNYVGNYICCDPAVSQSCHAGLWRKPCHIELAGDHLQYVYETLRKNSITYLINYGAIGFLANLQINLNMAFLEDVGSLSASPFAFLSVGTEYFGTLLGLIYKMMMMTRMQQAFLDYLNYPFFGMLMFSGLVLRIFPFTRKTGGMLVAIALCAYLVFPMFYVLNSAILWGFLGGPAPGSATPSTFGNEYDRGVEFTPGYGNRGNASDFDSISQQDAFNTKARVDVCNSSGQQADIDADNRQGDEDFLRQKWKIIKGTKWHSGLRAMFLGPGLSYDGPLGVLAMLMIFSTVFPFLGLMTTLAAFKALSPMLGGDVELGMLSRLI